MRTCSIRLFQCQKLRAAMSAFGIRVRAQRWSRLPEQAEGKRTAAIPLLWFLPGPERMRGGAARHFASDRHFHRGIHPESTCGPARGKETRYQRLAESRSRRAGFLCGSQGSHLAEATLSGSQPSEVTCEKPLNRCVISVGKAAPLDLPKDHRRVAPGGSTSRALSFSQHCGLRPVAGPPACKRRLDRPAPSEHS